MNPFENAWRRTSWPGASWRLGKGWTAMLAVAICLSTTAALFAGGAARGPGDYELSIISWDDWDAALTGGDINPMSSIDWWEYMGYWEEHGEGDPYPMNEFLPCGSSTGELYVYEGGDPGYPDDAGLVMSWGNAERADLPAGSYSSAWTYTLGHIRQPVNLGASLITITVTPPSAAGINAVSFGIQDSLGRIRSWFWTVTPLGGGGPLIEDVPNTITIDTSKTGMAAAVPMATGYTNTPGFDITQSQFFIVDENSDWTVAAPEPIPPPGQTQPNLWNYWHDLIVTPLWPQHKMHFPQLPDEDGWDVNATFPVVLADDWMCAETGWVKDVHFWGSWKDDIDGEIESFLLSIHADIPADQNPDGYSKPLNPPLWETTISDFTVTPIITTLWEGWYDPFIPETLWNNHQRYFQYDIILPEADWFWQDVGTIYWLNISAHVVAADPQPVWGWKSTENHWNDDAVWGEDPTYDWVDLWEPTIPLYDDYWIVIDEFGTFVAGGGTGWNGDGAGPWYFYDQIEPWWNQWFYDHPYDNRRIKDAYLEFEMEPYGAGEAFIQVAINWATEEWSLLGNDFPPPPGVDEELYIGRDVLYVGEVFPMTLFLPYRFPDFNPEWVSIDVTGVNFRIGNLVGGPPGMMMHDCRGSLDLAFVITGGPTAEEGACCYDPTGGGTNSACIVTTQTDCENNLVGVYEGDGTTCLGVEACCLGDGLGTCVDADALCCTNELGGTPQGAGTACSGITIACCLPGGGCINCDLLCCDDEGGMPSPINAPFCMGDVDNNGINDACEIGWQPGDPHKMHFPQLPDEAGWDVNATQPLVLADDFMCTQSGPIKDIHFWGSWKDGVEGNIDYFVLSLHEDIPADQNPDGYSKPGITLWERDIWNFGATPLDPPTMEGWYDPSIPEELWNNHQAYFQYDVYLDPADWFEQVQDTIYWLNISAVLPAGDTAVWGWKSTEDHWNDDAVWALWGDLNWVDMWEPELPIVDAFDVMVDATGAVVGGGGTGFNDGEWYYYPETDWWNQWFYDHPVDLTRRKLIHIEFDAMAFEAPLGLMTVAANWSTPDYSNPEVPPLPPLDEFIVRDILVEDMQVSDVPMHYVFDVEIPDYNPEWVSIDIRGTSFMLMGGIIEHTCQGSLDLAFVITNGGEDPTGACCYDDANRLCVVTTLTDCVNNLLGVFEGAGTTCQGMEACCLPGAMPGSECMDADALCCTNELGGIPQGPGTTCTATEACCLSDNTCVEVDPLCCDELGGTAQGDGSVCGGIEACCLADDTCVNVDALCCVNELGGTPMGAGTLCTAPEACCFTDGSCTDLDPLCCTDQGGDSRGPGSVCLGDLNGNTINDACELIKWDQSPVDLSVSGLHAHDDPAGRIIVADQWMCEGGVVTDFHWWGTYEDNVVGNGLAGFHLSIHMDQPGTPWCLPGAEIWSADIPMAQITEVPTGLVNAFGEVVYAYHHFLEVPFEQEEGNIYWLDISANSAVEPIVWKWAEHRRDVAPPIICPAAYRVVGGVDWTSIVWPPIPPEPERYSDMAFQVTSEEGSPPVVAPEPEPLTCTLAEHCDDATGSCVLGVCVCVDDDDCLYEAVCRNGICYPPKNRYVSFLPSNPGATVAFRVTHVDSSVQEWADTPTEAPDDPGVYISRLVAAPVYRIWTEAVIHVGDCEIVPDTAYLIQAIDVTGDPSDEGDYSAALSLPTVPQPVPYYWADVVGAKNALQWQPPQGVVNFMDVNAAVKKFEGDPTAPALVWMDINPEVPNMVLNFADIQAIVNAFVGSPYPFSAPEDCP